jgi:hypothetical protein
MPVSGWVGSLAALEQYGIRVTGVEVELGGTRWTMTRNIGR